MIRVGLPLRRAVPPVQLVEAVAQAPGARQRSALAPLFIGLSASEQRDEYRRLVGSGDVGLPREGCPKLVQFPISQTAARCCQCAVNTMLRAAVTNLSGCFCWWALEGLNLRPLPCEGNALPLS